MGCCPFENAVCCKNGLTCCPENTECVDDRQPGWPGWGVVTTCQSTKKQPPVPGVCVCKPGAALPFSTTKKNIIIIGDSVSIGYTPHVAELMESVALVQHAPWGGDGGAEETAYGLQCLDYWLHSPAGLPLKPDLVYFNFGLHDGPQLFKSPPANVTIPGQEGNMTVYPGQLAAIAKRLVSWASESGAKLLFGITSPMLADARADQDVRSLNSAASDIMAAANIPTVNLHAAVVGKCGPVPQASCFDHPNCFSPHCRDTGYAWLANSTIVPAIKAQLSL